jgi:hypothetical protein
MSANDPATEPLVMISHTGSELYLAKAWRDMVCSAFGLADASVWFSSEPGKVSPRRPWEDYIEQSIDQARAIISIQSPASRMRPWIIWEAGMARALEKSVYVIVYEAGAQESILGKLGTPIDRIQHFPGTNPEEIKAVIQFLHEDIKRPINLPKLDEILHKYLETVAPHEDCWVQHETIYVNRIQLVLGKDERRELAEKGVIADSVWVQGDLKSMILFDLVVEKIQWRYFIRHLEGLSEVVRLPWPGSAARWAGGIGMALQRALSGFCAEGSEGLPLYFDARKGHSYRPSLFSREDDGEKTIFSINFTHPPEELTGRINTGIGILFHYFDFCQNLRWGVLENERFVRFFRNPQPVLQNSKFQAFVRSPLPVRKTEVTERLRDFLRSLSLVRTEFWNQGFKKDSIFDAIDPKDHPVLRNLLDTYSEVVRKIDPDEDGTIPNPLPDLSVVQQVYSDLLRFNKALYQLLHRNLGREVATLAGSMQEISTTSRLGYS